MTVGVELKNIPTKSKVIPTLKHTNSIRGILDTYENINIQTLILIIQMHRH